MTIFCKVCGEIFKNDVSLIRHRRCKSRKCELFQIQHRCLSGSLISYLSKNSTFKVLKCIKCGKTFFSLKHLLIHMRLHTNSTPYKCDFCSKTFMMMVHLYYHLNSHREDNVGVNKCIKCNGETRELLRKFGLAGSTVSSLGCLFCQKRCFSNIFQFTLHLRTHCPQTTLCSDCGCVSVCLRDVLSYVQSQAALTRTRGRHYPPVSANTAKIIQCESCGRTFQKLQLLELHLLSHISDPLFCCRNCQEVFRNSRLYMMHMKNCLRRKTFPSSDLFVVNHSTVMNDETFSCPYCKLIFSSPSQLQTHLPLHSDIKESKSDTESADDDFISKSETEMNYSPNYINSFVCPNCGQVFREKEKLQVHMNTDCPPNYNCNQWSDFEKHINDRNCTNEQSQPSEYEDGNISSKPLYSCSKCYKSFISNASLDSHMKLHLAEEVLPSSGKDPKKIQSYCSSSYHDPTDNGLRNHEKEWGDSDNCKGLSDGHCLCDVCGEVFYSLVDLDPHMKIHDCEEVCAPIYTTASINNPRQSDIYQNQSPLLFSPSGGLSTPCFVPSSRADNIFPSRPDMNSDFARNGTMTPVSHSTSFSAIQTNNVSVPTFTSSVNTIPFIPSVDQMKNVPCPNFVSPGFPFHMQNNRANFFPIPNFDNRSSASSLSYGDCRDNLPLFPYNNSRFNVFYSVPAQEDDPQANDRDKNINPERNGLISPFMNENKDKIPSPLTITTQNMNLETVPQQLNTNIQPSTSDHQNNNTVFIAEKEGHGSNLSPGSNLDTSLPNNGSSFPVSFSDSKNTNLASESQNNMAESESFVPIETNANNVENQNLECPVNELLMTLPNLSQDPNPPGVALPENEPLNLCQARNIEAGTFYNYPVDLESKGFFPQQAPLNNLHNNMQAAYPIPPFWEESKSYYEMNFNDGNNQCPTGENEGAQKFIPGFQTNSIQHPLWGEPKTYYNMSQGPFRDQNYDDVDGRVSKMNVSRSYFPGFFENRNGNVNYLYGSQNRLTENESTNAESRSLEYMPFLRLRPTFSNSVSHAGNGGGSSSKDGANSDVKDSCYQDSALAAQRDADVELMQSPNVFASNQAGAEIN